MNWGYKTELANNTIIVFLDFIHYHVLFKTQYFRDWIPFPSESTQLGQIGWAICYLWTQTPTQGRIAKHSINNLWVLY